MISGWWAHHARIATRTLTGNAGTRCRADRRGRAPDSISGRCSSGSGCERHGDTSWPAECRRGNLLFVLESFVHQKARNPDLYSDDPGLCFWGILWQHPPKKVTIPALLRCGTRQSFKTPAKNEVSTRVSLSEHGQSPRLFSTRKLRDRGGGGGLLATPHTR